MEIFSNIFIIFIFGFICGLIMVSCLGCLFNLIYDKFNFDIRNLIIIPAMFIYYIFICILKPWEHVISPIDENRWKEIKEWTNKYNHLKYKRIKNIIFCFDKEASKIYNKFFMIRIKK